MKPTLLASALVAVVISYAAAQDTDRIPTASLDLESAPASSPASPLPSKPQPPPFCKPCLFYAGDFDGNATDANGLANEVDLIVSTGATTYTPFIVPKGKIWTVTGLFTDNFMSFNNLDPKLTPYEVRRDIPKSGGNGGHLVCHGKKPATVIQVFPQACQGAFGFECFAVIVNGIKGCRLPAGKYWMSVVPYCTGSECIDWRAFLTNDDGAMAHRYGPLEPANDSFFNSQYFGANWESSSEQQSSKRFSVGVEGTAK